MLASIQDVHVDTQFGPLVRSSIAFDPGSLPIIEPLAGLVLVSLDLTNLLGTSLTTDQVCRFSPDATMWPSRPSSPLETLVPCSLDGATIRNKLTLGLGLLHRAQEAVVFRKVG